jgi:hypothetical protein
MADIDIKITVKGRDRVQAMLDRALRALRPPAITGSVGKGADVFVGSMREAAPVKTGALRASIDKQERGGYKFTVGPRKQYAKIQNDGGTVTGKPLMGPIEGGYPRFLRRATIPGTGYAQKGFAAGVGPAAEAIKSDIKSNVGS